MIDQIAVDTSREFLSWGPPGVVILLMIAGMIFMYRYFMRRELKYEAAIEAKDKALQDTLRAQMEDIRNLAKAGEAFRVATERITSLETAIRMLAERQNKR